MRYETNLETGEVTEHEDAPVTVQEPTPVVILPISPRQIRQALNAAGLRSDVETAVNAAVSAGDLNLKDWWEYSTSFDRMNPQVIAMGEALGQTPEQLDALWQLGSTL